VPDDGIEQLFGAHDSHLRTFEELFGVRVRTDGNHLLVEGEPRAVEGLERTVRQLSGLVGDGYRLSPDDVRQAAQLVMQDASVRLRDYFVKTTVKASSKRHVAPKSLNQRRYLEAIDRHDVVFGVGPAGTGKTYLAMAQAVAYLTAKKVTRIILARPAVEAGERLGFLPGDMQEKVNPYLRPLYDALYDMLDLDRVDRLLDRRTIEIAPLAFMRGRTLNDAFVILDEAQNTTAEQMKMFLTRLGFDSKAVITGDITQIDLPPGKRSGLLEAIDVVSGIRGIAFVYFNERDVVRHTLVQQIIKAYESYATQTAAGVNGGGTVRDGTPAEGPNGDRPPGVVSNESTSE
jgi:phosphate starvation-inducible PhoH-like protein